jgi:hypothetical protein
VIQNRRGAAVSPSSLQCSSLQCSSLLCSAPALIAEAFAVDQQLSADRARRELAWNPRHLDPLAELRVAG